MRDNANYVIRAQRPDGVYAYDHSDPVVLRRYFNVIHAQWNGEWSEVEIDRCCPFRHPLSEALM